MTRSALADLVAPAWQWCPPYVKSYGDEVAEVAALAGFAPDPEQRLALEMMFAVDQFNRTVAFEFGIVASRQNLKTALKARRRATS